MADRRVIEIDVKATANAYQEIKRMAESMSNLEKSAGLAREMLKGFAQGIGQAFSFRAVVDSIFSISDALDETAKSAQKVGVSVEEFTALQYAADLSGVSVETMTTALGKLSANMYDLSDSNTEAAKSLKMLGVTADMTSDQGLSQIADKFAKMPDGVNKTALAMQIFGKSGKDLIPLLNEGADGIAALKEEAAKLGVVMDGDAAAAAENFNDNMSRMKAGAHGVALQFTQGMMPALSQLSNALVQANTNTSAWKDLGKGAGTIIKWLAVQVYSAAMAFKALGMLAGAAWLAVEEMSFKPLKMAVEDINKLDDGIKEFAANLDKPPPDALPKAVTETGNAVEKAGKQAKVAKDPIADLFKSMTAEGKKLADQLALLNGGMSPEAANRMAALNAQIEKSGATGGREQSIRDQAAANWALQDAVSASTTAYEASAQAIKDADAATKKIQESRDAEIAQLNEQARPAVDKYYDEYYRLLELFNGNVDDPGFAQGMLNAQEKAFGKMTDKAKETSRTIEDVFADFAKDASSNLVDFVVSGKKSFSEFATSMIEDLGKVIVRFYMLKAIQAGIDAWGGGAANGAAFDAQSNVVPFQKGGLVRNPTTFAFASGTGLMGEAGTEAIMPLRRNAAGELGVSGGGGTVINIVNNTQSKISTEETQNASGERQITVLIEDTVNKGFGAGRFDRSMSANYGIARRGR